MNDRRAFLKTSGSGVGALMALQAVGIGALFSISCTRREVGAGFSNLTQDEAHELESIAGQIIPVTDTPGAVDAGVIYFIDAALDDGSPFAGLLPLFRQGLADLTQSVAALGTDAVKFSELNSSVQIDMLRAIENTPFFGNLRVLTLIGFLADPKYGGNRNGIGWDVIGLDNRHAWQPPFGYYDEQYRAEGGE